MDSIRRKALRVFAGLAAAILVGFGGASTASAQTVAETSSQTTVHTDDLIWN